MRHIYNLVLLAGIFVVSLNVSWQISSFFNFYYPPIYSLLEIDHHVEKFAIKNENIKLRSFSQATKSEHFRVFNQIVKGINNKGEGLDDIVFFSKKYNKNLKFLTHAEVVHLQDVANLVSFFNQVALFSLIICIILLLLKMRLKLTLYSIKELMVSVAIFLLVLIISVVIIGPYPIFKWLHETIFSENQWFFYYQESLMTTLMKAPDIFAVISLAIFIVASFIFMVLMIGLNRWFKSSAHLLVPTL